MKKHHAKRESAPLALRFDDRIFSTNYPGLADTVRACLAVCLGMTLKNRNRPLGLILEGRSGSGKTTVIQMFNPKAEPTLGDFVYRSDKFTPKSFVSHAANVRASEMENLDLLPRLRNKILLTKELAPIFRGRDEEVSDNFAILISVLDGDGFVSDSGMRGRRGYDEPIMFNWIGATTPLAQRTHQMMAQLGTRLLFYEVPSLELSDDDLLNYALKGTPNEAASRCNAAVNNFLISFFKQHPVATIDPAKVKFSRSLLCQLTRWAKLLVTGRAEINYEDDDPISASPPEGAWRVVDHFKDLARGHALIDGRTTINRSDLELIAHVAISSLPGHIRPIIRRLCGDAKSVTSSECEKLCGVSRPTARKRLRELELLGIVTITKGTPSANSPDTALLHPEFAWLRTP